MTRSDIENISLRFLEVLDKFKVTSPNDDEIGYIPEEGLYTYWKIDFAARSKNEIQ